MARKVPSPTPVAHCISSLICYAMTLPLLTPALHQAATTWIESLERHAQTSGRTLDARECAMAAEVGVCHPERIRVLEIDSFPQPPDPQLRAAAQAAGLLGPETIGLTAGYGILLRRGFQVDARVLSHECRHVSQYECAGSVSAFLAAYLDQVLRYGYHLAPLEQDARAHERPAYSSGLDNANASPL